jgi:hypothetical protein
MAWSHCERAGTVESSTCCRATDPRPLHQAVLSGLKSALHSSLRLRTVRRNPGDPQLLQRPADLRRRQLLPLLARAAPVPLRFHRGLKQGRLVGVVTQRPPMLLYVPLAYSKVLTFPTNSFFNASSYVALLQSADGNLYEPPPAAAPTAPARFTSSLSMASTHPSTYSPRDPSPTRWT